jgi:hypothetical protein
MRLEEGKYTKQNRKSMDVAEKMCACEKVKKT